jgi:pimeloyl-ACP methyl ester carboxylesterase
MSRAVARPLALNARTYCAVISLPLAVVAACTRQPAVDRPVHEVGDAAPAVDPVAMVEAGDRRDALAGYPELYELREGPELIGVVSVPVGAREPRPIMVALHGGSDRPERACPSWRIAADAYPFVVCPRGWGGDEARLGWGTLADTKARIARAVALVRQTFGAWVKDTDTVVLAGFSMGASEVARLAASEPQTYRRIVIGDSAHDPWPALSFSRAWAAGGGERTMFMCTTSGCEPSMRAAAKKVAAQKAVATTGASARLVVAPTQVHALSARAAGALRGDWAWLVEGAEGWEQYVTPAGATGAAGAAVEARTESFEPSR